MSLEEPKFTRALQEGNFELRDYAASVVAEVTVSGGQKAAGAKGFRRLAGYIFGANATSGKIAMTAPVSRMAQGAEWLVRFTMPSHCTLADLPKPTDLGVRLRALPPVRRAVLRFSGLTGEAAVAHQTAALMALIRAKGLVPVGPVTLARYNPPWTPWFLRRNEVMLAVSGGA